MPKLQAFRAKAIEMGLPSLATGALIGWEWLQREVDIFATLTGAHYRPKEYPNMLRVIDEKTSTESWIPLFDDDSIRFALDGRAGRNQARAHRRPDVVPRLGRSWSVADMAEA
jgi:hypothetical protein